MKINQELTKLYYSIGEVAEMFGVSTSLIRYWEKEFHQLRPQKNKNGDRQYKKKDIFLLEKIYTLVKERGFTLEGARKELRADTQSSYGEVISDLLHIKEKLEHIRKILD